MQVLLEGRAPSQQMGPSEFYHMAQELLLIFLKLYLKQQENKHLMNKVPAERSSFEPSFLLSYTGLH